MAEHAESGEERFIVDQTRALEPVGKVEYLRDKLEAIADVQSPKAAPSICQRSPCSVFVGTPVDGPARWQLITTTGVSITGSRALSMRASERNGARALNRRGKLAKLGRSIPTRPGQVPRPTGRLSPQMHRCRYLRILNLTRICYVAPTPVWRLPLATGLAGRPRQVAKPSLTRLEMVRRF